MPLKSCYRYRHNADTGQRATVAATLPDSTDSTQLKPRLPRTSISKIPRQVHEPPDSSTERHVRDQDQDLPRHQENPPPLDEHNDEPLQRTTKTDISYSKYLTFSKDQAASHFNALKEELNESLGRIAVESVENESGLNSSQWRPAAARYIAPAVYDNLPYETEMVAERRTGAVPKASQAKTSPRARSACADDHQQVIVNNVMHDDKCEFIDVAGPQDDDDNPKLPRSRSANNNDGPLTRQPSQPLCEAFIMTGKSMLKLSCNETDSNLKPTATKSQTSASVAQSKSDGGVAAPPPAIANQMAAGQAAASAGGVELGPAGDIVGVSEREPQLRQQHVAARQHEQLISADQQAAVEKQNNKTGQPTSRINKAKLANCPGSSHKAMEFKSGLLYRKHTLETRGKPTGKGRRGWRRLFLVLVDLKLISRPPSADQQHQAELTPRSRKQMLAQDHKNAIKLHHSFAKQSDSYKKREYVFELCLADQSEFLLQADSEQEMNSWIDTINFASACLSAPAMPSIVSHGRRYLRSSQRPILAAVCTKLSYWEQLVDHEERLQRLKQDLEEHLNEAPAKRNAEKRAKSEFIERIAYLRHEIRRYSVYVELMRKKSNSHEAITLSKHPQIASLEPSEKLAQRMNGGETLKVGD